MDKLVGINVDGTSVNLGKGVGTVLKEKSPWIQVIHRFNHCVEHALKDTFRTTSFEEVDSMLSKLYYLYQKSLKRLSELREFSEAYDKTVPKPSKATGIRWTDHKYRAMELFFQIIWFVYVTLGTARTDRFASSKTNRDLRSCKEMEECQFNH